MHDAVKAFSIISCACFQGCLPPSDILWSKEEFKGEYGALWGSHHIKKPGKVIVVLSGKIIRKDVIVHVLIHEMTYQYKVVVWWIHWQRPWSNIKKRGPPCN